MASARNDPFRGFNFIVEIDGIAKAGFSEVSGLELEIAAVEYREGGDPPSIVRKLPGLVKYTNIVLKRGFTSDSSLWDWIKTVLDGNARRAAMKITLLDDQGQPAVSWKVREAWPCKYGGPEMNAKDNDIAIELLEICHEGLERVE